MCSRSSEKRASSKSDASPSSNHSGMSGKSKWAERVRQLVRERPLPRVEIDDEPPILALVVAGVGGAAASLERIGAALVGVVAREQHDGHRLIGRAVEEGDRQAPVRPAGWFRDKRRSSRAASKSPKITNGVCTIETYS